eukprot:GFYU01003817.1.p1 GENE.GFYU01003817.1~~GFYU01003817.1.p1  ORF type:complete len:565 (+),score=106.64 GFYU01003817.1:152-1846(+)
MKKRKARPKIETYVQEYTRHRSSSATSTDAIEYEILPWYQRHKDVPIMTGSTLLYFGTLHAIWVHVDDVVRFLVVHVGQWILPYLDAFFVTALGIGGVVIFLYCVFKLVSVAHSYTAVSGQKTESLVEQASDLLFTLRRLPFDAKLIGGISLTAIITAVTSSCLQILRPVPDEEPTIDQLAVRLSLCLGVLCVMMFAFWVLLVFVWAKLESSCDPEFENLPLGVAEFHKYSPRYAANIYATEILRQRRRIQPALIKHKKIMREINKDKSLSTSVKIVFGCEQEVPVSLIWKLEMDCKDLKSVRQDWEEFIVFLVVNGGKVMTTRALIHWVQKHWDYQYIPKTPHIQAALETKFNIKLFWQAEGQGRHRDSIVDEQTVPQPEEHDISVRTETAGTDDDEDLDVDDAPSEPSTPLETPTSSAPVTPVASPSKVAAVDADVQLIQQNLFAVSTPPRVNTLLGVGSSGSGSSSRSRSRDVPSAQNSAQSSPTDSTSAAKQRRKKKNKERRKNPTDPCAICFIGKKDAVFLPCGHQTSCVDCATTIMDDSGMCPICRVGVERIVKTYVV